MSEIEKALAELESPDEVPHRTAGLRGRVSWIGTNKSERICVLHPSVKREKSGHRR